MKPQAFFMHKIFAYEGIISSSNSSFELTNGHEFELLLRKKTWQNASQAFSCGVSCLLLEKR